MNKLLLISLQKYGGGVLDSWEISNALLKNNFFHYIIISNRNEIVEKFSDEINRKVLKIETFESTTRDFLVQTFLKFKFLNLIKAIHKIKPEWIFFTHRHPWQIFILLLKPFFKFKIVYSCHDNPFNSKESENKINLFFDRLLTKNADIIVVYSEFMKTDVTRFIRKKKIVLIPLGPYSQFYNFKKKNFNSEKLVLGFFGRILPYKGLNVLLRALEILKNKKLNVELYILGKGKLQKEDLMLLQKLKVNFVNKWMSYQEIFDYMNKIDLIVLPYQKATQSGIISLCLAINMPFIISDVGGLREFIINGETGLIFKSGDFRDLAEKLEIVYNNKKLLKIFSENIENFKRKFEWSKNIKNLIKLL